MKKITKDEIEMYLLLADWKINRQYMKTEYIAPMTILALNISPCFVSLGLAYKFQKEVVENNSHLSIIEWYKINRYTRIVNNDE